MPVREVGVFVERVVDLDSVWKNFLGDVQNLAAVCSVAVFLEVNVHDFLELAVIAVFRIGGGCCKSPAVVLLA